MENTKSDFHSEPSEEATSWSFRRFSLDQMAAVGMEIPSVSQNFQLSVGVRKREDFQVTVSVL